MSNPDFSKSPEHVALAKAIGSVYSPRDKWEDFTPHMKGQLLMFADAAITHLGSGYVLPPATEENAERLARAFLGTEEALTRSWPALALVWLRALHAAFGDAEKPDTTQADRCSDGCVCERCGWPLAASVSEGCVPNNCSQRPLPPMPTDYSDYDYLDDPTYCRPGCDKPFGHPGQHSDEEIGPGWADKANRDDYRREVILALAANSFMMQQAMGTHAMRANSADWLVQWADVLVEAAWK